MIIETPLGITNTKVNFNADLVEAKDGDIIENNTDIVQSLDIINLSLGSRYIFKFNNKIGLFAGSGLGFDYIFKSRNEIQTEVLMESKILTDIEMVLGNMDKLSRHYFSYYAGLGLEYKISYKFGVQLETQFKRSLSSLRISEGNLEPRTFLQQINLGLGINYQF